jgi:hypothetical protein
MSFSTPLEQLVISNRDGNVYARGESLLLAHGVQRYRYLLGRSTEEVWLARQKIKAKEGRGAVDESRDPRPPAGVVHPSCLMPLYIDPASSLKWAPRDALEQVCTTLAAWRSHGYGSYELLFSLIGGDKTQVAMRQQNKFIWVNYSYLHLSFDRFVKVLRQLDPYDRLFCFMIPTGVPVHMYFDIDGDFGQFPYLIDQDEACLDEFLQEVRALFQELFGRDMDCSGLTLLQATSATKLSWHLHVQSEAFRDIVHMKRFVLRLNEKLKSKANTLLHRNGKSLVDPAPYMANQNFRAPYCCKPGKMALLPRGFSRGALNTEGRIKLKPAALASHLHANIDEELVWRCHPALAQPGVGYQYLELEPLEDAKKGKRKAPSPEQAMTTSNRARKLHLHGDAATGSSSDRANTSLEAKGIAVAGSARSLSLQEDELVKAALAPHLGAGAQLDSCTWYQDLRAHRSVVIRGACSPGTANCLTRSTASGSPVIHRSNRMFFTLRAATSRMTIRCSQCDAQAAAPHQFSWAMSERIVS